ncbi:MAG: hypothetical protein IJ514_01915 [Clostridia bacterium]|nr:hypothetical protein [Clostridia bacterium]
MHVDKVILRAALSTLAAILALIAFMVLTLSLAFPSTWMKISYDLGMDGVSVRSAKRAYDYSGDVAYIAYATEVAIGADDDERIEECGELFIADDDFVSYCSARNQTLPEGADGEYEQYVYGQVSVAKYRLGDKDGAVDTAFDGVESGFPKNNAVVSLLLTALQAEDAATVDKIETKMNEMAETIASDTERAYLEEMRSLAENG